MAGAVGSQHISSDHNNNNETSEGNFLFQRVSVLIQRFNAVLLHDCFVDEVAGHSS